jgi:hypothetical protein
MPTCSRTHVGELLLGHSRLLPCLSTHLVSQRWGLQKPTQYLPFGRPFEQCYRTLKTSNNRFRSNAQPLGIEAKNNDVLEFNEQPVDDMCTSRAQYSRHFRNRPRAASEGFYMHEPKQTVSAVLHFKERCLPAERCRVQSYIARRPGRLASRSTLCVSPIRMEQVLMASHEVQHCRPLYYRSLSTLHFIQPIRFHGAY